MRSSLVSFLTLAALGCGDNLGVELTDAAIDAGHDSGSIADAGQDASFDAGADVGPADAGARFAASAGGSVTDSTTGLVWVQVAGGSYTQGDAALYCSTLTFDGASGWRLPTKDELVAISGAGFPAIAGGTYWSSSTGPIASTWWYVAFATGAASASGAANTFGARCVR